MLKGQKYDERSQLYEMRRTFKNNALEFLTSFNGDLLEEKNYGDCSMVFSVVGVYLS